MKLSNHTDLHASIFRELELLDENPVLLNGRMIKPSSCFRLSGSPLKIIYNTNCPDELKKKLAAILLQYHHKKSNVFYFFLIEFDWESKHYTCRLTPEFKKDQENPSSWHVVLNETFFGYLHKDQDRWENSDQRPAGLTEKVGGLIDTRAYEARTV